MVTSKDVSTVAGVSRATVSHVINNSGYVSPELIRRVEAAIEQLNYRPHAIARSLAARKTFTVGVVVARLSSAFYPPLLSALESTLTRRGYTIVLCDSHEHAANEQRNLSVVAERRVDGIIWVPCSDKNVEFVRELAESGTAIVVVDRRIAGDEFDTVASDNENAGYIATKYLFDRGYRRIAIVTFSQTQASARERCDGYRRALGEAGVEIEDDLVCVVDDRDPNYSTDTNSAVERTVSLLRSKLRPQAIFACSDLLTLSVLEGTRRVGLRIPKDLAVLGFDHSPWTAFVDPPLSVVIQQTREMGAEAARILLRVLKRKGTRPRSPLLKLLPTRLIQRKSCGE